MISQRRKRALSDESRYYHSKHPVHKQRSKQFQRIVGVLNDPKTYGLERVKEPEPTHPSGYKSELFRSYDEENPGSEFDSVPSQDSTLGPYIAPAPSTPKSGRSVALRRNATPPGLSLMPHTTVPKNPGGGKAKPKKPKKPKKAPMSQEDEKDDPLSAIHGRLDKMHKALQKFMRKPRVKKPKKLGNVNHPIAALRNQGRLRQVDFAGAHEARMRNRKARQNFRHVRSGAPPKTVSSVQPEEIKLMVKQEGPGQYQVRSRGVNKVVRRQVRNLLARVKGKLYVNGTLVASSKAFGMIIKLLMDKKVVHVKIVSQN